MTRNSTMGTARPFLIGHRWKESATAVPVINPFTGQVLAEVCQAGKAEADEAMQESVAACEAMRRLPAHARAQALDMIANGLFIRREEMARLITAEAGKPITDARREVDRGIHTFRVAAEEAKRVQGEVIPLDVAPGSDGKVGIVRRFPIGPILGITPFNFPLNLVAHKVAPALAAGNPIVIKPAPQTPLTALMLGEVVLEAGLPSGAFSVLPCENSVAEQMVMDPRFAMLSFTGSVPVGWRLKTQSGKKRVALELGGNAGVIVEPDADVDLVAQRCAVGGFSYSGQSCISVQRIFVHETVFTSFVNELLARTTMLKAGDPSEETTVVGPLIDEAAAQRVEAWIEEAVGQGARVLAGGKRQGSVVVATVLTDVIPDMKVSGCEVFGPVVTVMPYSTFDEALGALNNSDFGLQAGVFTNDVNKIFQAYQALDVGAVLANEIPTFRAEHMPYGGVKDSGIGREGVRYAMEEMTEPKLLVLNFENY